MITKTTLSAFIIATSVFSALVHAKVPASFNYQYDSLDQNTPKLFDSAPLPQDCSVESFGNPAFSFAPYRFGQHDKLFAEGVCILPVPESEQFRNVARRNIV